MSPEEDRTRDAVDSEPKHYQLSYSGPRRKKCRAPYSSPSTEYVLLSLPTASLDRLVGLVVKASASRAEGPGFESR